MAAKKARVKPHISSKRFSAEAFPELDEPVSNIEPLPWMSFIFQQIALIAQSRE
jgi:hypothetical protein